jgi:hypothetical protein
MGRAPAGEDPCRLHRTYAGSVRRSVLVLVPLLALALAPSAALAATPVSYEQLLHQIYSGPVIRAIINRPRGDIEIKFRDLSEWESPYPRSAQPMIQRLLHQRHIRVLFAARPHSARPRPAAVHHHHLRYIAAAALAGLLLIGAGAYLSLRRRRSARGSAGAAPES